MKLELSLYKLVPLHERIGLKKHVIQSRKQDKLSYNLSHNPYFFLQDVYDFMHGFIVHRLGKFSNKQAKVFYRALIQKNLIGNLGTEIEYILNDLGAGSFCGCKQFKIKNRDIFCIYDKFELNDPVPIESGEGLTLERTSYYSTALFEAYRIMARSCPY